MELREVEEQLEELETRIERLRALYEQYFMGIEKVEPQIPRKDVERRIWLLRREQIRNTGMRFKFQMLVQRYNSFQQYWGRTTREIESGTYRRDVLRAAKRFGNKAALTIVGRRRAEKYARLAEVQKAQRDRRSSNVPPNGDGALEPDEIEVHVSDVPPPPSAPPVSVRDVVPLGPQAAPNPSRVRDVMAFPSARVPAPLPPPMPRKPPEPRVSEPLDAEGARRKVAALAAEMKAQRVDPAAPTPPRGRPRADGPLDLDLDLDTRRPPPRRSVTPSRVD